jgi:dihydrofolate synthase/folylpolyglutamate synthase
VIKQTNFQGRWQQVHTMPNVIVDVGHNEDGIKHILENLKQTNFEKLYIIYGAVKDKDISKIVSMLPIDAEYAITSPKVERKLEIKDLEVFFKNNKLSYQSYTTVENAIEALLKTCNSEDLILIIGSFFIVNDAISYFGKPKNLLTK